MSPPLHTSGTRRREPKPWLELKQLMVMMMMMMMMMMTDPNKQEAARPLTLTHKKRRGQLTRTSKKRRGR